MSAFLFDYEQPSEYIFNVIQHYNQNQSENPIRFIHANSSLTLSLVGKTATVTKPRSSEIIMVPYALIPHEKLRKKYGIYPLVSDVKLAQIKRINKARYHHLFGTNATSAGVRSSYASIQNTQFFTEVEEIHKLILKIILKMTPRNYIRSLKQLLVMIVNMVWLDKTAAEKGQYYLELLKTEGRALKHQNIVLNHYFDKYFVRIENILKAGILPLPIDTKLREELQEIYPIFFCSTIEAIPINEHESFYPDELYFETVKIAFTPEKHLDRLKAKLAEIGLLDKMIVHGFLDPPETLINQESEDLPTHLMKNISAFLMGQGNTYLLIAARLIINAEQKIVTHLMEQLAKRSDFVLHQLLDRPEKKTEQYTRLIHQIISPEYIARLANIHYLQALLKLRCKLHDCSWILDYEQPLSNQALQQILEPKQLRLSQHKKYLFEYLLILQDFYAVLVKGWVLFSEAHQRNCINTLMNFVRGKYLSLLEEYEKDFGIDEAIIKSELYQAIKTLFPETKRHWFQPFHWHRHAEKVKKTHE